MRALAPSALFFLMFLTGCVISPRRIVNGPVSSGGSSDNGEFTVTLSPSTETITAGNTASYTVDVEPENGFTGSVTLSASDSIGAIVSPSSINVPGNANVTVSTSSSTQVQTDSINVTATDPGTGATQTASATLQVQSTTTATATTVSSGCPAGQPIPNVAQTTLPSATGSQTAIFDAVLTRDAMTSEIGLVAADARKQPAFANLVQFQATGMMNAYDGVGISSSAALPYQAGETYRFRFVDDFAAGSYSVFVAAPGETETALGTDLQLPPSLRGTYTITGWGIVAGSSDASPQVCNFALR